VSTAQRTFRNRVLLNGRMIGPDNVLEAVNGNLDQIIAEAFHGAAPLPDVPTYRQFSKVIRLPDGPAQGQPYTPDTDAVHDTVIEQLDGAWTRHVWLGCVQSGKSLLLSIALLRNVTYNCKPVVYSQPTLPKIHEAWVGKIMPVVDACDLVNWKPQRGQGSHGSQTPRFYQWWRPGGVHRAGLAYLIPGGGTSEAAQAAVTAQFVCVDEVDSFTTRHRVELIAKRADSYLSDARRVYTSTLKDDSESIILGMYNESTKSRLHFACPHCKAFQPLEWENVRYDAADEVTAGESVRYACSQCGVLWDEHTRLKALTEYRLVHAGQIVDNGEVVGVAPRAETFGLIWTALDSSLRDMRILATEHYRAQQSLDNAGDHGPMRSFWRDQLCRQYKGELEELDADGPLTWNYLYNRSLISSFGPVRVVSDRADGNHTDAGKVEYLFSRRVSEPPADTKWSVGAIDVQHNRVYWILRAFDDTATSWLYAWGYEYARLDRANASPQETEEMLARTRMVIENAAMGHNLQFIGLDVADNTESLLDWANTQGGLIRPMRGTTQSYATKEFDIDGLAWFRDGCLIFQADHARDLLHASFRRKHNAQGATLFPAGMEVRDNTVFRHMVSEQAGFDMKTRKRILLKGSGRNDWLDCAKMSQVLMQGTLITSRDDGRAADRRREAEVAALVKAGKGMILPPEKPSGEQIQRTSVRTSLQREHDREGSRRDVTSLTRTPRKYRRF